MIEEAGNENDIIDIIEGVCNLKPRLFPKLFGLRLAPNHILNGFRGQQFCAWSFHCLDLLRVLAWSPIFIDLHM